MKYFFLYSVYSWVERRRRCRCGWSSLCAVVVVMLSSPVGHSGWWCGEEGQLTTSGRQTGRRLFPRSWLDQQPQWASQGERGGRQSVPQHAPFTACLTALALRECWARRDWAGLGFNRQGSLCVSVCVCVLFPQHCGRPGAGPSGQSASRSVSQPLWGMLQCRVVLPFTFPPPAREFTWMLFLFPPPPSALSYSRKMWFMWSSRRRKNCCAHRNMLSYCVAASLK